LKSQAGSRRKAAAPQKQSRASKFCQSACAFNCNGGSGWTGCPVRKCCTEKSIDFCFECADFPCDNWDEKGKHSNVFNKAKKERLQEMKSIGVEEWIKRQWE
jgi:hypothetical protein